MLSKQCINGMFLSYVGLWDKDSLRRHLDGSVAWGKGSHLGIRGLLTRSLPLTNSLTRESSLPSVTMLSSS